jgi:hypothetical protein
MDRYTTKNAESAFERLAAKLGKSTATTGGPIWTRQGDRNVARVGAWLLDHNSIYGGFVIAEIVNDGGGESHPLGDRRMPAREFCQTIYFAERLLEQRGTAVASLLATA